MALPNLPNRPSGPGFGQVLKQSPGYAAKRVGLSFLGNMLGGNNILTQGLGINNAQRMHEARWQNFLNPEAERNPNPPGGVGSTTRLESLMSMNNSLLRAILVSVFGIQSVLSKQIQLSTQQAKSKYGKYGQGKKGSLDLSGRNSDEGVPVREEGHVSDFGKGLTGLVMGALKSSAGALTEKMGVSDDNSSAITVEVDNFSDDALESLKSAFKAALDESGGKGGVESAIEGGLKTVLVDVIGGAVAEILPALGGIAAAIVGLPIAIWAAINSTKITNNIGKQAFSPENVKKTKKQLSSAEHAVGKVASDVGKEASSLASTAGKNVTSISTSILKHFEGFSGKAGFDVNAQRAGYGSDTVTDPVTGKVSRIQPGQTVTRAEADADLSRRINSEFIPRIIREIGKDSWNKLNDIEKAVLTSIAYNYGHLPTNIVKAAKTGDKNQLANAIDALQNDKAGNKIGVNKKRRMVEASLVRNSDTDMISSLVNGFTGGNKNVTKPPISTQTAKLNNTVQKSNKLDTATQPSQTVAPVIVSSNPSTSVVGGSTTIINNMAGGGKDPKQLAFYQ